MRVLFITHNFPPETNAPALRTYENCSRWVEMGHEVTVITGPPNFPRGEVYPGYRNAWLQREEMEGVQVLRTWMYLAANRGCGRRILNFISFMFTAVFASFFAPRCDLVVGTSPQFFVAVAAWVVATLRRCPFVFEVRDLWPESISAVDAIRSRWVLAPLHRLALFLYRRAARIVVVTHAFQEVLESYGVDPDKIEVVTNGVDLDTFRPGERENAVRRELGLNGHFVASYIGTLGMAHGLATVLDAAEELREEPEVRFLILGDGADRERLEREKERRGLANVLLLEPQPHERMPEFLAATDACMVLLKKNDLFRTVLPSKMFEAMGAGRSIILGVEGEAAAVVRAAECGVVIEPESAPALADAVRRLLRAPEQRERLGQNGRAFAREHYDRDVLAVRYARILEETLRPELRRTALRPAPAYPLPRWKGVETNPGSRPLNPPLAPEAPRELVGADDRRR